ncbi:RICIN domain-containing protein [Streptomyces sp. ISL-96]|uniref:RICIN domain-containing protein n=1 Tax=Streptomyces sp. ISL-96 TaxID=2819191 RepID=UPI001BEB5814|nr:RICIN domain-containing protein [Streptomyces sp. ISL-96]MBT2492923.1 RICIN domain-containing protein [Streptomyces sp. ISL-96]
MPQIPAGRSYRIKNQRSNLYMNVSGYSANNGQYLELWHLQPQSDSNRRSQIWHVFPLDFGRYLLANKASGQVVNVAGNSTNAGQYLEQYPIQPLSSRPAQQWMLHDVAAGAVQIINDRSQLLANLRGWSTAPGAVLEQWIPADASQATAQHWLFEVEDEYKRVLDLPDITHPGVGDIHRMTSYQPTPSAKTDPVEVGAMAYPFPLVQDPAYDRRRQAQENPYYILRRYGFWERVYSYEHGGASNYTHTEKTTVGLTTTNAKTVEETTSISVSAEASFGFKGVGASLSSTISHELKVITTHEEVKSHSKEVTIERNYEAGRRVTEAIWYRSDKYVLERLNGTTVLDWTTRDPNTSVADAYPLPAREAGPHES